MLSNSLIFLTSMPWITPRLVASLACQPSRSGDIDGIGLSDEAVDGGRSVEVLHRDLEAEILGGLVADRLYHRVGHADVPQLDVLDVLRPDHGRADDIRCGGAAGHRRSSLQ